VICTPALGIGIRHRSILPEVVIRGTLDTP
jgi:hypothetical protein